MRSSTLEDPVEMKQGWTLRQDRELRVQKSDADFYRLNETIIFLNMQSFPGLCRLKAFLKGVRLKSIVRVPRMGLYNGGVWKRTPTGAR